MLKLLIIDFDGLIVDTEVVWHQIYSDWFKRNINYDLSVQEFLICVGSNSDYLFDDLDSRGIHVDRKEFARSTFKSFIEQSNKLPAKDGVEEFLRNAKLLGLKVALATSSSRKKPETHLNRLGLMKYFDALITADDVDRIKPDPDLFLKAAEIFGCNRDECLVVEDSSNGLRAGLNAQMKVLIVPNDVTIYSDFRGCYLKCESLGKVNLRNVISDFETSERKMESGVS